MDNDLKTPKSFPNPLTNFCISNLSVTWFMFGGYDFPVKKNASKYGRDHSSLVEAEIFKVFKYYNLVDRLYIYPT